MQPNRCYLGRTTIAVVGGVGNPLIIEGDVEPANRLPVIIGLGDIFAARMRQLSVADEDADAAGIQIALMRLRDAVDDASKADPIVGSPPGLASKRAAYSQGAVDIGKVIRFDRAVADPGACEQAERVCDGLLDIDMAPPADSSGAW